MQSKKSIEIQHCLPRNVNTWPQGIVLGLGVRHYDVQSVGRAALKNDYQAFSADSGLSSPESRARQKTWYRRRADNGKRAIAKKNTARNRHHFSFARSSKLKLAAQSMQPEAISSEIPAIPKAIRRSCSNPAAEA